ncbi:hypothetical protein Avbf_11319, partial [Armadillidium vulgare]
MLLLLLCLLIFKVLCICSWVIKNQKNMIESHVVEDVYLIIFIICGSFAVFYYHREEITTLISRWWR